MEQELPLGADDKEACRLVLARGAKDITPGVKAHTVDTPVRRKIVDDRLLRKRAISTYSISMKLLRAAIGNIQVRLSEVITIPFGLSSFPSTRAPFRRCR